jgi:hypothetical protein
MSPALLSYISRNFPGYVMLEKIPHDMMAQMVAESEKAARAAIERFAMT